MKPLLALAHAIDALNERVGRLVGWLVLAAVLVSSGNALMRYAFNLGSNAWLELQWYLFSAIFLLAAGYTLKHNQHVRIDILTGPLSQRAQAWIDIAGSMLFLLPMAAILVYLSWPMFVHAYLGGEVSADAGGLIRWPVKILMPLGFALLALQGVAETIKRIALLRGACRDAPEK